MTRAVLPALALACLAAPAHAQVISGPAVAVDGDTLDLTGIHIRLMGIDAVEGEQTCEREGAGQSWACGEEARALLGELVAGRSVVCEQRDRDEDGRVIAVCRAGRTDLARVMAEAGFAVALPQFSEDYVEPADAARAQRRGVWATRFVTPADWRAANPRAAALETQGPARAVAEERVRAEAAPRGVYYRNCDAARAAGAAPLYAGEPGYRSAMDGDGDGVACEPYRGR